jgi:hypothetical protein
VTVVVDILAVDIEQVDAPEGTTLLGNVIIIALDA